jgi:hypothetical protein
VDESRAAHIEELTEARDTVARHIDILLTGRPYGGANRQIQVGDLIRQLRDTLSQLEECIADESDPGHR